MKRVVIATLFNESDNVSRWWNCLREQTLPPDEIVIVDGGSTDGTWEKLQELAEKSPVPVRLKQQRCNIAEGRNLAIRMTDAEIIASTDAGSFPEHNWFEEITRPLLETAAIDIVGGKSVPLAVNDFQKLVFSLEGGPNEPGEGESHGSGRNTAYRRETWADIGGYPEWLTLTGEDALFNHQLHRVGKRFAYNPAAVVHWMIRENEDAYLKMLYLYGIGSAEAQLGTMYYFRRAIILLFPPLLLLSRHRFAHLNLRFRKNFASVSGWLAGWFRGRRPPEGWKKTDGVLLSPEAQECRVRRPN
jgi:glycosyltransferase involved in cell wall biosynthesis